MSANEKIFPAPDILNEVEYGKFVLTNLAAKRAKQIKEGAPPLVRIDTNHPLSIALEEIAKGKIKPILGADAQAAELDEDYSALDELGLDDVGLLLPSIEEDEDSMDDDDILGLGDFGLDDEDDDDDSEDSSDEDADPLAALLGDDDSDDSDSEETDVVTKDSDEATEVSLDDLAEEEEAGNDEESDD
ncbi:MAG: DNA-directed RNA polymerase subunit omega [Fimbriimonadaceae bacterium]|nr:DNA-directed RNA polymerase subunit omega [Fimbriimonadaceae bacterium]